MENRMFIKKKKGPTKTLNQRKPINYAIKTKIPGHHSHYLGSHI
jgi:hypothetical protein